MHAAVAAIGPALQWGGSPPFSRCRYRCQKIPNHHPPGLVQGGFRRRPSTAVCFAIQAGALADSKPAHFSPLTAHYPPARVRSGMRRPGGRGYQDSPTLEFCLHFRAAAGAIYPSHRRRPPLSPPPSADAPCHPPPLPPAANPRIPRRPPPSPPPLSAPTLANLAGWAPSGHVCEPGAETILCSCR